MQILLKEIKKTETYKSLVAAREQARKDAASATRRGAPSVAQYYKGQLKYYVYLTDPIEMFARAYAQYVAWRSGNRSMLAQIDGALARQNLWQWPYKEFLPFIYRFDTLFEEQGWLTRTKL